MRRSAQPKWNSPEQPESCISACLMQLASRALRPPPMAGPAPWLCPLHPSPHHPARLRLERVAPASCGALGFSYARPGFHRYPRRKDSFLDKDAPSKAKCCLAPFYMMSARPRFPVICWLEMQGAQGRRPPGCRHSPDVVASPVVTGCPRRRRLRVARSTQP
jgi:hypothetical protein